MTPLQKDFTPSGNQSRQMSHPWDNNQWCPGVNRISNRDSWWLQMVRAKAEWQEITQYRCIQLREMSKVQTLGCYIFCLLQLRVCRTSGEHLSTLMSLQSKTMRRTRGIWHVQSWARAQCNHHHISNWVMTPPNSWEEQQISYSPRARLLAPSIPTIAAIAIFHCPFLPGCSPAKWHILKDSMASTELPERQQWAHQGNVWGVLSSCFCCTSCLRRQISQGTGKHPKIRLTSELKHSSTQQRRGQREEVSNTWGYAWGWHESSKGCNVKADVELNLPILGANILLTQSMFPMLTAPTELTSGAVWSSHY